MSEKIKNKLIAALILKQICVKFQSYELAVHCRDIERTIDGKLNDIDRDNLYKEFNYNLYKIGKDWVSYFENTSDSSILSEVNDIITSNKLKSPKDMKSYIIKVTRDRKISSIL